MENRHITIFDLSKRNKTLKTHSDANEKRQLVISKMNKTKNCIEKQSNTNGNCQMTLSNLSKINSYIQSNVKWRKNAKPGETYGESWRNQL